MSVSNFRKLFRIPSNLEEASSLIVFSSKMAENIDFSISILEYKLEKQASKILKEDISKFSSS